MISSRPVGDPAERLVAANEQLRRSMVQLGRSTTGHIQSPSSTGRPTAFLVMPFGSDDLEIVYEHFVKPVIEDKCGLNCLRGDDMFGSNTIMDDLRDAIMTSRIVIADLTGRNANVFYEVGMAHALGKPVLLLSQSPEDIPFDLRHRRVLPYEYTPLGCKQLEQRLEANICHLVDSVQ